MPTYQDPKVPFVPDRTQIPLHEPHYAPITDRYVEHAAPPPPRFTPTPPKGAPNVLIVLIDDMGYGASSAFGGPVPMPVAENLAKTGMRFNRFHTTSICAPTRAAILSGYNHHACNMGNITEVGTAYPGNLSTRPKDVTPVARVLRDNGYSTAQFGKCHETPVWEVSPSGPFDHWPSYSGFDKFYGFMAAEASQYSPELYDGTTLLDTPDDPDYHLSEDLATKCIDWMRTQKGLTPDKPFFTYFVPGATHAPHQVHEKYRDMFKGKFDEGWDAMREHTHARMQEMGIVPKDAPLAPKARGIRDWDSLPQEEKDLYARQMEIYAGYAYHVDEQVGRVFDAMKELGIFDDTLIFYILGDNGASAEGTDFGVINEMSYANGLREPLDFVMSKKDVLGTEYTYNHYASGWAVALDAPFTWCKQVASNFGGTRNGMIIHYPARFKGNGEVHSQFHHCIDVAPTILEVAGIPIPEYVDGIKQRPMEGTSMVYAMENKDAPGTRKTQYFTISRNRGVYHDGWFAGTIYKAPWEAKALQENPDDDVWELYNLEEDFCCANDLADKYPDKVKELQDIYYEEAVKHNVLPLDDRAVLAFNAKLVGRPTIFGDRREVTLYENIVGLKENAFLNMKNTSFTIEAEVEVKPGEFTDGVVFCQGGRFGGYSLYVKDGIPCFCYNFLGMERYYAKSSKPLSTERCQLRVEFKYDGGGIGKGGNLELYLNNEKVGEGRVDKTMGLIFSPDDTASVGLQRGTPVTEEYTVKDSRFKGHIYSVNIKTHD